MLEPEDFNVNPDDFHCFSELKVHPDDFHCFLKLSMLEPEDFGVRSSHCPVKEEDGR